MNMNRITRLIAAATLALAAVAFVGPDAAEAATAEEKCQKTLSLSWGKYELCVQKATGAFYGGGGFEPMHKGMGKCVDKLVKTWPKVVKKYPSTTCVGAGTRYTDNGDTFTDNLTRRVWEKKTDDGSIHDKDDLYTWSDSTTAADGGVWNVFLGALNSALFAGQADWRLPTLAELNSLFEPGYPNCTTTPCTTVPGDTHSSFYWSSPAFVVAPTFAWGVDFGFSKIAGGGIDGGYKVYSFHVRAVRGGS